MENLSLLGSFILVVITSPCSETYTISDYRLIAKDRPNAGIVEVYTQQRGWGLVCTYNWNFDFASTVCRHLNFPGNSLDLNGSDFDEMDNWPLSVTQNISTYYWECSIHEMNMQCGENPSQHCEPMRIGAVTCKEPGYLGCYDDPPSKLVVEIFRDRTLSEDSAIDELTVDMCISLCRKKGFFYAGVEFAYQCFCGTQDEDYNRHGNRTDEECNTVCQGDPLESCGGSNRIAIYQVDLGVCDDPGTPTNGIRYNETDSLRYGSKLYFNCSDGYILEGPDVIQCVKTHGSDGENAQRHDVSWNHSPPYCTQFSSTIPTSSSTSTVTAKGLSSTNQGEVIGTHGTRKQEGHQNIIYIGIGIASGLIIFIIIVVVVVRKRHKRRAKRQDSAAPATDSGLASRNHGDGGNNPLVPGENEEEEEEDLFVLTELTSHSNTANENHYADGTDGRPPTQTGSADRPAISRGAFGYESIRLPSTDSVPNGSGGTKGDDSVGGATDLYANTEFHEVPTNLIDNELYG